MKKLIIIIMCFFPAPQLCAQQINDLGRPIKRAIDIPLIAPYAYPVLKRKWSGREISVCWENFNDTTQTERENFRVAVFETWESESGLSILGWNKTCALRDTESIHLYATNGDNVTPRLGLDSAGTSGGIFINFKNGGQIGAACKYSLDKCVRAIIIHEFGHALGFSHEQNRPDYTDTACLQPESGVNGDTISGVFSSPDPDSIMDLCNPSLFEGKLSAGDKDAVRFLYGLPSEKSHKVRG